MRVQERLGETRPRCSSDLEHFHEDSSQKSHPAATKPPRENSCASRPRPPHCAKPPPQTPMSGAASKPERPKWRWLGSPVGPDVGSSIARPTQRSRSSFPGASEANGEKHQILVPATEARVSFDGVLHLQGVPQCSCGMTLRLKGKYICWVGPF